MRVPQPWPPEWNVGAHAELLAASPDRVVVVERVVADGVDPATQAAGAVVIGPRDRARQHDRLESELTDGVVELGDRFFGRVRRNRGDRLESVAVAGVHLGVVAVDRMRKSTSQLGVRHRRHQPIRRVHHREVDAELVEAPVHQVGQHDGRPVEGVSRRQPPDPRGEHAELRRFAGDGTATRPAAECVMLVESPGDVLAGILHDEVPDER